MAKLKDKIENALNESRTLVLGAQVLVGFQYHAFFQPGFERLSSVGKEVEVGALVLLLLTLALLMSPAPYHRLVAHGEDTLELHNFTSAVTGAALFPFAVGLAIEFYIALELVSTLSVALVGTVIALLVILFFWYGLEIVLRMRRGERAMAKAKNTREKSEAGGTSLADKVKQVLTESRIVLPGAQALLGFQFAAMLMDGFNQLAPMLKLVHLLSLVAIGLCTILLMTPAAYHRIVEDGEDSEFFVRFAGWMILGAMVLLALGIAGDFYVVVVRVFESEALAIVGSILVLIVFYGLWFGLMWILRARQDQPLRAR
ncbi:MAG TPA: DUF6328 family protein [Anaerolineae bacterium]|nr:DUF6328 family protein [Anaerolineae bacterium]